MLVTTTLFSKAFFVMVVKSWDGVAFENIVGNGDNAGNQYFLLFPQYFVSCQREKSSFHQF